MSVRYASIVVIPKSNGDVRICVDLAEHQCLPRMSSIPAVDQTLAQISGACMFPKLVANGILQIPRVFFAHNFHYTF